MAEAPAAAKVAPYLPFSTFQTALSALEQGVPRKLHPSLWRSLSGTAQKNIMASFRFLGFMNDVDESMPPLKRLIDAKEDGERKAVMRDVLSAAYPRAIELASENATAAELREAISMLNVQGDTARKAVAFFMKAAEWSELPISPHWKSVVRRGPASAIRRSTTRRPSAGTRVDGARGTRGNETPPPSTTNANQRVVELPSGRITLTLDVNLLLMTDPERRFVFQLIDDMAAWGQDVPPDAEPEDEDDDYEFEEEDES